MEEWKQIFIDGIEWSYEVSTKGRVRNKHGHILSLAENGVGYLHITLYNKKQQKTYYVHRLVGVAFIPNPHGYATINHKDHDRHNNCVENLEWIPQEQQYNDKWQQSHRKQITKSRQKKVILFDEENTKVIIFQSVTKCAKYLGVKQPSLSNIIRRGQKCKGYKVRYVEEK